jgi:hypothetical protein
MVTLFVFLVNKNAIVSDGVFYFAGKSDSTLNLVRTQTSGTSVHMARSTVDNSLDPLDIGLPGTVGTSVGVGNLDTKGYALTAKITLRHSLHLPSES